MKECEDRMSYAVPSAQDSIQFLKEELGRRRKAVETQKLILASKIADLELLEVQLSALIEK